MTWSAPARATRPPRSLELVAELADSAATRLGSGSSATPAYTCATEPDFWDVFFRLGRSDLGSVIGSQMAPKLGQDPGLPPAPNQR